ncbi:SDR family oxidoreductase [Pseudarthrobacter sp. NamE2]|nr:SDR family oxidoreductase [Pseudarthrobacter sp. NamE2]
MMPSKEHGNPQASPARLQGRVALVTGAAHNIGAAIALRLAEEGAAVAVADIDAAGAAEVCRQIVEAGGQAFPAAGDLTDIQDIDRIFAEIESALGPVDVLVNNAYTRVSESCFQPFLGVEPVQWQQFVAANTTMFFACSQRMARRLATAGLPGSIVNISSHGAARAHREQIPYDAVKGAMESFTRAIAVDLAPWGIRANAVRPGSINVQDGRMGWDVGELQHAQIPLGRQGTPMDVAHAVVFLASHESDYITGQVFNIDGGLAAQARAPQVEPHPPASPTTFTDFPVPLQSR